MLRIALVQQADNTPDAKTIHEALQAAAQGKPLTPKQWTILVCNDEGEAGKYLEQKVFVQPLKEATAYLLACEGLEMLPQGPLAGVFARFRAHKGQLIGSQLDIKQLIKEGRQLAPKELITKTEAAGKELRTELEKRAAAQEDAARRASQRLNPAVRQTTLPR